MNNRYRPVRSGKRSLATALMSAVVIVGGAYVVLDKPSIPIPAPVSPPDAIQRSTRPNTEPLYAPSTMAKKPAVAPAKTKAAQTLGIGVFKCVDANSAVTYSEYPCDDGKLIDTKPTSSGFSENWSINVKGR